MERLTINGLTLAYELTGPEGAQAVAITPGGRFTMDAPGIRELAAELVKGGRRALIYDRPNCGYSDATLQGESESETQAEALTSLIRALDIGPTAIVGGSGGARVSLLAAARDPEICSHLAMWWMSGEPIGLMSLASYYCGDAAILAARGGMEAVLEAPAWAENLSKSSQAKDYIRGLDPDYFIAVMQKWASAYVASDLSPVPGMKPVDFARITMPTIMFRSAKYDLHHTLTTSKWVNRLIPHSKLINPPWREDEWNYRSATVRTGESKGLFESWPALAPILLEFTGDEVGV